MPRARDPQWLADVRLPGPNPGLLAPLMVVPLALVMEDDTDTGLFTPGCGAYAGYANGTFANMTAVRAYAASQGARSFSYTPNGDPAADALDIEPGDAVPDDGPGFYRAKGGQGVHLYCSASTSATVLAIMAGAGIARSSWKLISAHYTGTAHICGPGTCGYPQADATQFTDAYNGRSLDATLVSSSFWGAPASPWPLTLGSSGPDVVNVQDDLNSWSAGHVIDVNPALAADGNYGPLTAAAVRLAQAFLGQAATGEVSQALYATLQGSVPPVPPPPSPPAYPVPAHVSAAVSAAVTVTWAAGSPISPHWRVQLAADAGGKPGTVVPGGSMTVLVPKAVIAVPRPGAYWYRVQAAGNSPFTVWEKVTA